MLRNDFAFFEVSLAAALLGAYAVQVNWHFRAEEAGYVLRDFAKADADWLDDMLRGVSDGAGDLAAEDTGRFMNAVARRLQPAKEAAPKKKAEAPALEPEPAPEEDSRSPLQRLVDKFR